MNVVIIPAAGIGKRMGGDVPKQFALLAGKPIIAWTLERFQSSPLVDAIIIAAQPEHHDRIRAIVAEHGLTKVTEIVDGGETRQDSVWNALKAVSPIADLVLVHDAVRPLVSADDIRNVVNAATHYGGALLAVRVKDTIKQSDEQDFVENTLDREYLWSAQTPQVFKREILTKAFQQVNKDHFFATDESSIVEYSGGDVKIVEGSYTNIKITTAEDLVFAGEIVQSSMFKVRGLGL